MKKRVFALLLITVFLALALSSCGSNGGYADGGGTFYSKKESASVILSDSAVDIDAKLIRTVNMHAETTEYDTFLSNLKTRIDTADGYISYESSSSSSWSNYRSVSMTIRIPANKLTAFCDGVRAECAVTSYTIYTDDVTLDYATLKAKVDTLKSEIAVVDDLYETLKTAAESSGTGIASGVISELQTLSARKTALYTELNTAQAKLDYYDNQVSYSTVELYLSEVEKITEPEKKSFFGEAGEGFVESLAAIGDGFRAFGVWFISALPHLVVIGGIGVGGFFAVRAIVRKMKRDARKAEEKAEQEKK